MEDQPVQTHEDGLPACTWDPAHTNTLQSCDYCLFAPLAFIYSKESFWDEFWDTSSSYIMHIIFKSLIRNHWIQLFVWITAFPKSLSVKFSVNMLVGLTCSRGSMQAISKQNKHSPVCPCPGVPEAPGLVCLSISSSTTLTVSFQEPQCFNSTVVTKYKGKHTYSKSC